MASTQDDVVVRLRLKDVAKFIADVKAGKLAIEDLEKKIQGAGRTAAQASASGGGFSKMASHFGVLAGFAKTGALALGAATVGVAGYALKSAASFEQVQVSMETMLGSQAKARTMMADLQKFAKDTPFEFGDVAKQAQHLLAFGFAANSVKGTLTAVGNAASGLGLGAEGMDRIVTALGQMRMKGHVQGDEMLQLAESGINANAYLERAFHLTPEQLQKAQQAGKISAAAAIPVILAGMDAQFKGLMDKQSHTLSGIWSNFHDSLQQGLVKAVNPFLPTIEGWLQSVTDKLPGILTRVGAVVTTVAGRVQTWVSRAMDVIPYLQSHGAQGVDDYGASNIIARLFGDKDGKSAATIENLIGMLRNFGRVLTDVVFPAVAETARVLGYTLGGALAVTAPLLKDVFGFVADHKEAFKGIAEMILAAAVAYKVWTAATWLFTAAQTALDIALDANPIGLVVIAIAALTAGFVYAYNNSETFRNLVNGLWSDMKGFADWIIGVWNVTVGNMGAPKFAGSDGTTASVTPGSSANALNAASWWLNPIGSLAGLAGGAVGNAIKTHQATGGTTVRPGLSWVGERGPELLNMPRGAQVIPLPRGGGASQPLHVHVEVNGREIATAVLDDLNARAARR